MSESTCDTSEDEQKRCSRQAGEAAWKAWLEEHQAREKKEKGSMAMVVALCCYGGTHQPAGQPLTQICHPRTLPCPPPSWTSSWVLLAAPSVAPGPTPWRLVPKKGIDRAWASVSERMLGC